MFDGADARVGRRRRVTSNPWLDAAVRPPVRSSGAPALLALDSPAEAQSLLRDGLRTAVGRDVAVDLGGERLGIDSAQDITGGMLRAAAFFPRSNLRSVTACDFSEHPRLARNPNRTGVTTPDGHIFFNLQRLGADVRQEQLAKRHQMVQAGTAPFRLPHLADFDVAAGHEYIHTVQRAPLRHDDPRVYTDVLVSRLRQGFGYGSDDDVRREIEQHYGSYPLSGRRELGAVLVTDVLWNPREPHRFSSAVTGELLVTVGSPHSHHDLRPARQSYAEPVATETSAGGGVAVESPRPVAALAPGQAGVTPPALGGELPGGPMQGSTMARVDAITKLQSAIRAGTVAVTSPQEYKGAVRAFEHVELAALQTQRDNRAARPPTNNTTPQVPDGNVPGGARQTPEAARVAAAGFTASPLVRTGTTGPSHAANVNGAGPTKSTGSSLRMSGPGDGPGSS